MSVATERHLTTTRQAREAFAEHCIEQTGDRRWLLRKPGTIVYSAEIICGAHKDLIVNGDIDLMVFAYGPQHPEARVHWMGKRQSHPNGMDGYLLEKAHIGMTGDALIYEFSLDRAIDELEDWGSDLEDDDPQIGKLRDLINDLRCDQWGDPAQHDVIETISDALGPNFLDDRYDIGMVPKSRVYYAHAALARLSALLTDAKALSEAPTTKEVFSAQGSGFRRE